LPPVIVAESVWVGFLIRYHRSEVTLRETFVRLLDRLSRNGDPTGRWSQKFWALRGVSLTAQPGDVIGIVGRNGSGKTTLLKTLAGIIQPDRGRVAVRGKVGCLMSFGVGFKTNLSGRENVFINGSILGLSQRQIRERLPQIIELSELGEFIDAPVRTYSSGMKGRLGFAIAVHLDPDVLLLDEVFGTGDAAFREKAGTILDQFRSRHKTVIFASHDMGMVKRMCNRAIWLDQGQVRLCGSSEEVARCYLQASAPAAAAKGK